MDQPQANTAGTSDSTASCSHRGTKLSEDVYSFHEPKGIREAEVVFIHGLQWERDDFENAYWSTWLARDGTGDTCWPITWLPKQFPNARILSLSYDACAWRTATTGRMDGYLLGENLVQQITSREVGIGQSGCPVVFVSHSLGGLIAKQIVVSARENLSETMEVNNLLHNLKAFFFYATPHRGSMLASLVGWFLSCIPLLSCIPYLSTSPLVEYIQVMNTEVGRLNSKFEQIHQGVGNGAWKFYVAGEMHATECGIFSALIVSEASARHIYPNFMGVAANHINVCKPEDETDAGFQHLTRCIREVSDDFNKNHGRLLELPSCVVGIEDKLKEVRKKMDVHPVVGLVGMGGIGKTTLSKHLFNHEKKYNHERNRFEKFCFLEDVRSRGSGACQKQLFHALCGREWKEGHVDIQLEDIKECIVTKKVLLVVDDVGGGNHLKDLQVDAFKNTEKGSKVIVTTRRRDILSDYREAIVDVELLNEVQASELFSFYAFHGVNEDERKQLGDQAKAIIKACGELPLSLEVIGQYLRKYNFKKIGERMDLWKDALRRLNEAKPFDGCTDAERLWARLKISYDDLHEDEQSMFLDFACIICELRDISGDSLSVRAVWLGRIWNSPGGVQNLINMSLIKWNDDEPKRRRLVMHDQLRDMGRGIVRKVVDANMSRIWWKDECLRFSLQNRNNTTLEGLVLRHVKESEFLEQQERANRRMNTGGASYFEKLRLLDLSLSDLQVVEYYVQMCSEELTWLCLNGTQITVSSIRELGSFTNLRVLEMECTMLVELPTSIGKLSLLKELRLKRCESLKTLPDSIGGLKYLQILDLTHCGSLERLPKSIGELISLRELDCECCASLTEVPAEIGHIPELEALSFRYCWRLKSLCIFEARRMDHLRHLHLSSCGSLETVKLLGNLHCLKSLDLSGSKNLRIKDLPGQLQQVSQLQSLNLRDCKRLDEGILETIRKGQLCTSHLEDISLPVFPESELPSFPCLKRLSLANGKHVENLPESLGNLSHLEYLTLSEVELGNLPLPRIKLLPDGLCKLVRLKKLRMESLRLLERLPVNVNYLSSLQTLHITNCTKLVELPSSVGNLSKLQELKMEWCTSLERLPESLKGLTGLSKLVIENCSELQCWASDQSSILRHLKDAGCKIRHFPDREENRSFLQLIDDGADRDVIAQFIEEVLSRRQTRIRNIIALMAPCFA